MNVGVIGLIPTTWSTLKRRLSPCLFLLACIHTNQSPSNFRIMSCMRMDMSNITARVCWQTKGCWNFEFVRQNHSTEIEAPYSWAAHENTILNHIKDQLTRIPQAPNDKDKLIQFIESITNDAERSMVDLNEIALKCYFHPSTQGRTSLKKVLPAVLQSSEILKSEYSTPIGPYPASLNFPADFIWYQFNIFRLLIPTIY